MMFSGDFAYEWSTRSEAETAAARKLNRLIARSSLPADARAALCLATKMSWENSTDVLAHSEAGRLMRHLSERPRPSPACTELDHELEAWRVAEALLGPGEIERGSDWPSHVEPTHDGDPPAFPVTRAEPFIARVEAFARGRQSAAKIRRTHAAVCEWSTDGRGCRWCQKAAKSATRTSRGTD